VAPEELPTDVRTLAAEYACKAMDWGLDGVVCSGREAADVKQATRNRILCLCPGIRPGAFEDKFALHDDQRRVFTPQEAARAGADFLVVGRPVLRADVPALAAREIIDSYK
ncbi:MAG: orotidine 5'-phosphate decarboxylase, partial [Deltaproteobacteria bacterium]|nr:orotidine 5'-phosphate decarboxylase [Deltaproteobacteria bacterium]